MNILQGCKRLSLLIGALLVTLSAFTGIPVSAQERRIGTTVFTIPVGDKGVHYGSKRSGPAGLAVVPDGTVVIADTVGNRLLRYDSRGRQIGVIDLPDLVVGATDVEASLHGIFVLDSTAQPPKVLRLSYNGQVQATYELPVGMRLENGLSGITLSADGAVLVEMAGGTRYAQLVDAAGKLAPQPLGGYPYRGTLYRTQQGPTSPNRFHGYVIAGNRRIEVVTRKPMLTLQLLAVHPDGSFYVLVGQDISAPRSPFNMHQAVRHYSATGRWLRSAEAPLADNVTYVEHNLSVGQDRSVYALVTRPTHAEVRRLQFVRK